MLQTKVRNVAGRKCIGVLMAHMVSVKSLHPDTKNSGRFLKYYFFHLLISEFFFSFFQSLNFKRYCSTDLLVSRSRNGFFVIWDLRCKTISKSNSTEFSIL